QASHMDVAPTVLDLLGVRGETRFLAGRSLMSGTAPAAALTDLEAPERLRALRYANTFLLSGQGASPCQAGSPMLDFTAGSLHLGGREAVLSVSGERLAPDVLASSHALVGVLAADGSIASLTTAGLATLPHLLYTLRDETLLLVGPAAGLPSLVQRERTGEGILVLLGNPRGAFVELDAGRSVNELFVEAGGCAGLLEAARVPGDASDAKVLAEVCEAGAAGYLEDEVLRLPRVWIENGWYEAVLDGNAEDGFVLRERRALEDQADAAGCAAWVRNGAWLVPRVEGASGIGALTLRMVPGTVGEFENVRVFPR